MRIAARNVDRDGHRSPDQIAVAADRRAIRSSYGHDLHRMRPKQTSRAVFLRCPKGVRDVMSLGVTSRVRFAHQSRLVSVESCSDAAECDSLGQARNEKGAERDTPLTITQTFADACGETGRTRPPSEHDGRAAMP